MEPFNARQLTERLPGWQELPIEDVQAYIAAEYEANPVVKHIYGAILSPIERSVYRSENVSSIVVLWRERVEAAALSALIAERMARWDESADSGIGRIEPADIHALADNMSKKREVALKMAEASGKPFRSYRYEDIYEGPDSTRRGALHEIIGHLGASPNGDFDAAFDEHMSPDGKINTGHSYRHIENFDDLAAEFPAVFASV